MRFRASVRQILSNTRGKKHWRSPADWCIQTQHSLKVALAFAEYQKRVRIVLAPNPGENPDARCAIAIQSWLQSHRNSNWVERRKLYRGINGSRFGTGVFNRCLNNLQFNKEIEIGPEGNLMRLATSEREC